MKRDELNILAKEYYSVMDISDEQKNNREEDAWELFDLFMLLFSYFDEAKESEVDDYSFILPTFMNDFQDVLKGITVIDDFLLSYLATIALAIYTVTLAHVNDQYYLSEDRAVNLALNESNSINNYTDLRDAKENGYLYKKWHTEMDDRVRPTHAVMEGTTIPIDAIFVVGDSLMEMPHDITHGASAEEISNCRCWLEYV